MGKTVKGQTATLSLSLTAIIVVLQSLILKPIIRYPIMLVCDWFNFGESHYLTRKVVASVASPTVKDIKEARHLRGCTLYTKLNHGNVGELGYNLIKIHGYPCASFGQNWEGHPFQLPSLVHCEQAGNLSTFEPCMRMYGLHLTRCLRHMQKGSGQSKALT